MVVNIKVDLNGFYWKAVLLGVVNLLQGLNIKKGCTVQMSSCTFGKLKVKKFTVLRSPFVNKKSREQLQYKKYQLSLNYMFNVETLKDLLSVQHFNLKLKNLLISNYVNFSLKKLYSKV